MELFDTHCHVHSEDYPLDPDQVIRDAKSDGVTRLICVGTSLGDSKLATSFVQSRDNTWASIGLHPHDSKVYSNDKAALTKFEELLIQPKVVAIGECGLDYFYNHSKKADQQTILEFQLDLAQKHSLPVIFHVRDAFEDFWPIFDNFKGLSGVIHSFTSNVVDLEKILSRGLYVGLNGIVTFTKNADQSHAASSVPIDKLILETDSPYLTPSPMRGKVCQPKYLRLTAQFLASQRGIDLSELAKNTTENSKKLFKIT